MTQEKRLELEIHIVNKWVKQATVEDLQNFFMEAKMDMVVNLDDDEFQDIALEEGFISLEEVVVSND